MSSSAPVGSLSTLALWMSWPSVLGEFSPNPVCGQVEGEVGSSLEPWPAPDYSRRDLRQPFEATIGTALGGSSAASISLSGGLDSLAVLATLRRQHPSLELSAIVIDLVDDRGERLVENVRATLHGLGIDVPVVSVDPSTPPTVRANWSPSGPAFDALRDLNRVVSDTAQELGAQVLFTGNGADESIATTRFMLGRMIIHASVSAAVSYSRDSLFFSAEARRLEPASMASRVIPRRLRAATYWATTWPNLTEPSVPDILADRHQPRVRDWTAKWIRELTSFHATYHRSWGEMEAWDSLYPLSRIDSPGEIPVVHPFLDEAFLSASTRLPLERRYRADWPHPYWRQKSQVVALFDEHQIPALPTTKQTFTRSLGTLHRGLGDEIPLLFECGLTKDARMPRDTHPSLRHRLASIERWLELGRERGLEMLDDL